MSNNINLSEFTTEIKNRIELSKRFDEESEKIMKFWLKDRNYQTYYIRINPLGSDKFWEARPSGENYRSSANEKTYAEYEMRGRLKTVKAIWMYNYMNNNFFITLTPLTTPYDYIITNNGVDSIFEAKDRKFTSDSTLITSEGVMIERDKVCASFKDGYWNDFYYINSFSDGKVFTWHLSTLPNNTWVERVVPCNNSTVDFRYKKDKVVYFLPLESRCKNLDLRIA